ncbi:MAG: HEPN domain-containing protein, partial [Bradyrhizobium sp.]
VKDAEGYAFRVKNIAPVKVAIPSIDSEIEFKLSAMGSPAHSKATITASGWLYIRPNTSKALNWYLDQVWKATALLSLFAEAPMPPDRMELKVKDHGFALSVLLGRSSVKYCSHSEHHDFFASRTRLGDELPHVVATWFEKFPQVEKPVDLALSTMASEELWLHVRFLSLMQSLEGLHRALLPGLYLDSVQYVPVLNLLVEAIPKSLGQDHRASLVSRLRYGNEVSLARRLAQLIELLPIELRKRIVGSEKIPRSWVDTRNYYTHWDDALLSNTLEGQAMYDVSVRLTVLLRVLYLNVAGVGADTLGQCFEGESSAVKHLAQLDRKQGRKAEGDSFGTITAP